MLLHVRPRLFSFLNVALATLDSDALGLHLTGKELDTRRPYPSKEYAVACRRQGRKAIDGILIETPQFIGRFDIKTQWAVEALLLVTHHVDYRVIDRDFLAASDDMMPSAWRSRSAQG